MIIGYARTKAMVPRFAERRRMVSSHQLDGAIGSVGDEGVRISFAVVMDLRRISINLRSQLTQA